MKKNKGFTLVELLAVIAILAILVIIALPNVVGMFNDAKKSSFTTELKQIYKVAGQQWVMDNLTETGEKVYSKCSSCTGKQLQLSGRSNIDYYVKLNKAGKVVQFYATDGTYQFSYDGDLLATQISDIEQVSDLEEDEILIISNNNVNNGNNSECEYKILTDKGSFSTTEDVKELCINPVNDGYIFRNEHTGWYHSDRSDRYKWLSIYAPASQLKNGGYIKVYSDSSKTQLLGELNSSNVPDNSRIMLNDYNGYKNNDVIAKVLGDYVKENVYMEKSEGLEGHLMYTYDSADNVAKTYSGPWLKNSNEIISINNVINSINSLGYHFDTIENCDNYAKSGESLVPITRAQPGGTQEDYNYPNCTHNSYYIKYYKVVEGSNPK